MAAYLSWLTMDGLKSVLDCVQQAQSDATMANRALRLEVDVKRRLAHWDPQNSADLIEEEESLIPPIAAARMTANPTMPAETPPTSSFDIDEIVSTAESESAMDVNFSGLPSEDPVPTVVEAASNANDGPSYQDAYSLDEISSNRAQALAELIEVTEQIRDHGPVAGEESIAFHDAEETLALLEAIRTSNVDEELRQAADQLYTSLCIGLQAGEQTEAV
jgi:hypothetical protein